MSPYPGGSPQKETPQHPENAEGSGDAAPSLYQSPARLADSIISDDGISKSLTIRAASTIRRSVSKKFSPTGDPRIDATLADRAAIASRLENCGLVVAYRAYRKGETNGMARYVADRCGLHLLCPFCAAVRSRRVLARYIQRCDAVIANSVQPLQAVLVTFTVKNGPDLVERFQHLTRSLRLMLEHVRRGRASEFACFVGGAYGIEVKRGSGAGLWHPHCHMVALVPAGHYFDFKACKAEWLRWTGDSDVLNITPMVRDASGSLSQSLKEVFKYTTSFKPGDLSAQDRFFIHAAMRGRRLFGNFGALRDPASDGLDSDREPVQFSPPEFFEFDDYIGGYQALALDASVLRSVSVDGSQGVISVHRPGKGRVKLYGSPDLVLGKG